MKPVQIVILIVVVLIIFQCSDDEPIKPIDPPIPVDTCYNEAPLTPHDSVRQLYPDRAYGISEIKVSSYNGYLAGEYYVNGWTIQDFIHGQFVYDPATEQVVAYLPGRNSEWSNDGKKLLINHGNGGFIIINVETLEYESVQEFEQYRNPRWSIDEEWVYLDKNEHTFRVKPDGTEFQKFIDYGRTARQLDDKRFVGFNYDGMFIYSFESNSMQQIEFPSLSKEEFQFSPSLKFALSPDRTKILADVYSNRGIFRRQRC